MRIVVRKCYTSWPSSWSSAQRTSTTPLLRLGGAPSCPARPLHQQRGCGHRRPPSKRWLCHRRARRTSSSSARTRPCCRPSLRRSPRPERPSRRSETAERGRLESVGANLLRGEAHVLDAVVALLRWPTERAGVAVARALTNAWRGPTSGRWLCSEPRPGARATTRAADEAAAAVNVGKSGNDAVHGGIPKRRHTGHAPIRRLGQRKRRGGCFWW